jgi:hypothetical protein
LAVADVLLTNLEVGGSRMTLHCLTRLMILDVLVHKHP